MTKTVNYQTYLIESLKDPAEAAGYLNAVLKEGNMQAFLLALHNVVQARGGINQLASKTQKRKATLCRTLSIKRNPHFKSTQDILEAIGMHLIITPKAPTSH